MMDFMINKADFFGIQYESLFDFILTNDYESLGITTVNGSESVDSIF